jgi:hypothetical protein
MDNECYSWFSIRLFAYHKCFMHKYAVYLSYIVYLYTVYYRYCVYFVFPALAHTLCVLQSSY